jgi:hypothetical protein
VTDTFAAPQDLKVLLTQLGPILGQAAGAAAAGDFTTAYDTFMGAVCGPEHQRMLVDVRGHDGLARAQRQSPFFFADEMMTIAQ